VTFHGGPALVVEGAPGKDQGVHRRRSAGEQRTSTRIQCTACCRHVVDEQDGPPSDTGGLGDSEGAGDVRAPSAGIKPDLVGGRAHPPQAPRREGKGKGRR
jgi:hypothetical protein